MTIHRFYEEGNPVDTNDKFWQGDAYGPDIPNHSNFGVANATAPAAPGGNRTRKDATKYLNRRLADLPYEESVVLFDQTVEFTNSQWQTTEALPVSAGDVVKVTFDGVEYELAAFAEPTGAVYFGNPGAFGGEDNGIPFAVVTGIFDGAEMLAIVASEKTTASIKIEHVDIKTLDPKFLPAGVGGTFSVNVWYESGDVGYLADKTYEEIKAAEAAKTPIIGTLTIADGRVFTLIGADVSAYSWVNLVAFEVAHTPSVYVFHVYVYENGAVEVNTYSIAGTKVTNNDVNPK